MVRDSLYGDIIAAALTAKDSGPLSFDVILEVVKVDSQVEAHPPLF